MYKGKTQEILDNQHEQEKFYDRNVSLIIEESAKDEKFLDLDEAYKIVDSKFHGNQEQRLKDIKQLFEFILPRTFGDKTRPSEFQIGMLDSKSPSFLKEYHLEISSSCDDRVFFDEKEWEMQAKKLAILSSENKYLVILLDRVYYFENGELIDKIFWIYSLKQDVKAYKKAKDTDKLVIYEKIKKSILAAYIAQRSASRDFLLVRCSAMPCNHEILSYLLSTVAPL